MLVLSRFVGEAIVITVGNERIIVCLVEVRGGKARMGFVASPAATIDRKEIDEAKARERERLQRN